VPDLSWFSRAGRFTFSGKKVKTPTLPGDGRIGHPALKIAEKHGFGIYDALVVAAACEAGCAILYSEDFQDGQTIDGQLTIRNPFARLSG